jgi:hypothetical protein
VSPRGAGDDVAFPGVGVLAPPTPTPPVDTRIVELGVPCSGDEDASLASMTRNTEDQPNSKRRLEAGENKQYQKERAEGEEV